MKVRQATVKNLLKKYGFNSLKEAKWYFSIPGEKIIAEDFCICAEWDGKGYSTCGHYCPVHNEKAWIAAKEKEEIKSFSEAEVQSNEVKGD